MKAEFSEFNYPFTPLIGARIKTLHRIQEHFKPESSFAKRYFLSKLIAGILEPFRITEKWLTHQKTKNFVLHQDPLFIIGHWRSGTTLLHNLLSCDKQFGYCSTYQSLLPDLTLVHQCWLAPIMKWIMPRHRPADHVELNLRYPQEEEFALGNLVPWCFYYAWYFPQQFEQLLRQHILEPETDKNLENEWKQAYTQLIKIALINTRGSIYLSKNPPNTLRLNLLNSMFPDARYIFIIRNPYEVFESAVRFAKGVLPTTQLQNFDEDCLRETILKLMHHFFACYESNHHVIKDGRLIEIKYETLIADPVAVLKRIYAALNLGFTEHLVKGYDEQLAARLVKPFHYQFSAETIRQVNSVWSPLFDRFGYQKLDQP
ncbi:MAG: sulfotransferase [Cyclobacteriaceae bacterium]|jgi:hypothetical protein|nr:sulfotransferase [Cyclobacteriaceae bacterium]